MKARILMTIMIIVSTAISIGFTYHMMDSDDSSKTERECDLGIHTARYSIDFWNVTYHNPYVIKNGCINEISHNQDAHSLIIDFHKTEDGVIRITLPEFLYDLRPRSEHVVLADGEEIAFDQLAPSALLINFTENTKTLEIIDFTSISESKVTDSLIIPNAERDAKLAAGYKLYPGVGWVSPDEQKNAQAPIYMEDPNNPGELILDLDAMMQVQKISDYCNRTSSGLQVDQRYLQYENETHIITNDACEWRKMHIRGNAGD